MGYGNPIREEETIIRKFVLVMRNVIFNDNNNSVKIEIARKSLNESNRTFIEKMKKMGISKVCLTSIGNSIGTGFSFNDPAGSLLGRNEELDNIASKDGISIEKRAYARPQDNCDDKTFEYVTGDVTQADINKFVRNDYLSPTNGMYASDHKKRQIIVDILDGKIDKNWVVRKFKKTFNISKPPRMLSNKERTKLEKEKAYYDKRFADIESMVKKNYPEVVPDDMKLSDVIKKKERGLANIMVYNPFTGGFLDKVTRCSPLSFAKGFKNDGKAIYGVLKYIYKTNPDIQVYVCGMPCNKKIVNERKINVAFVTNKILAGICRLFPNCVYVEPVAQHLLYGKDGRIMADVHYNREEYLKLNEKIMQAIADDYDLVKCLVKFDQYFEDLHMKDNLGEVDKELQEKFGQVNTEIRTKYFNDKIDVFFKNYFLEYPLSADQLKRVVKYFRQSYSSKYFINTPKYKQNILQGIHNYSVNADDEKTRTR